ncbi:hypothetical protein BVC80_9019g31 [Macleaya cordata]|uniref:Uncharacterized protein n=1 Tax=Macleaya cordata TaxID=56857 RepID=A0A200QQK1_MACCD|nr:hypothetical protein BVC80_9019g31 [Macleaya cordata]
MARPQKLRSATEEVVRDRATVAQLYSFSNCPTQHSFLFSLLSFSATFKRVVAEGLPQIWDGGKGFAYLRYGFMFGRESSRKELGDIIEDLRRGNNQNDAAPRD